MSNVIDYNFSQFFSLIIDKIYFIIYTSHEPKRTLHINIVFLTSVYIYIYINYHSSQNIVRYKITIY